MRHQKYRLIEINEFHIPEVYKYMIAIYTSILRHTIHTLKEVDKVKSTNTANGGVIVAANSVQDVIAKGWYILFHEMKCKTNVYFGI